MTTEVKQPVAWALQKDLGWLVDKRHLMQREEWEHKFRKFCPQHFDDLSQSEERQEMFQQLSNRGLAQRHYASELDKLIADNAGWRAKIADFNLVCSAFPICDIGVCHHPSIESRKGYVNRSM